MNAIVRVFENEFFVVVDKPAGMLTVPDRGTTGATRRVLGLELQDALRARVYPVHRLDYVVSGLVLFAKTPDAHRTANVWFEQRHVHKTYRAWTQPQSFEHIPPHVANPRRTIELRPDLRMEWRGKIQRGKRRAFESARGQTSHTIATYIGRHPQHGYLMWDVEPLTGRPHQLRLDLSRHGFPIVGDTLYGSSVAFGPDRIALKAYRIDFRTIADSDRFGLPPVVEIGPEI